MYVPRYYVQARTSYYVCCIQQNYVLEIGLSTLPGVEKWNHTKVAAIVVQSHILLQAQK